MKMIKTDYYYEIDWQGEQPLAMDSEAFWEGHDMALVFRAKERDRPDGPAVREVILAFDFEQEQIWRQEVATGITQYCTKLDAYRNWRPHYHEYMKYFQIWKKGQYAEKGLLEKKPKWRTPSPQKAIRL